MCFGGGSMSSLLSERSNKSISIRLFSLFQYLMLEGVLKHGISDFIRNDKKEKIYFHLWPLFI